MRVMFRRQVKVLTWDLDKLIMKLGGGVNTKRVIYDFK